MNADVSFEAYFDLLDQIGTVLEELTEIAREKNLAVRKDDLNTLNACIKREQAGGMKLRALDQKRSSMLRALGLEGVPLSGLVRHCPEPLRPQARETAERLRRRCGIYRSAADSARVTLELNLHEIEKIIETQYGGVANVPDGKPSGGENGAGGFADFRA